MNIKSPAIRYHGAKFRLGPWIIKHLPTHKYYIEPFGGGAGVLLNKPRCHAEVYNDLDGEIVNFFRVLQDKKTRLELTLKCRFTPYSRDEFKLSYQHCDEPIEQARRLIIRSCMGFGSGGASKANTGFRVDIKRNYNTAMDLWVKYPDGLAAIGERFTGVQIENKPAIDLIEQHDDPESLFYLDPPYVLDTRVMGNNPRVYKHELSDDDHIQLLELINDIEGMAAISGYDNEIYNDILSTWVRHETESRISAGKGTGIRKEILWLNPAAGDGLSQKQLF